MKSKLKKTLLAIAVLGTTPAWAQMAHDMHSPDGEHGHRPEAATMSAPAAQPPGGDMNHDMHDADDAMPAQAMAPMDHGSMADAQGGTAPDDARDPHAYSGGLQLDSGPYALPGGRQLRMADEHNFASLVMNRLERSGNNAGQGGAYDLQASFGRDYKRLVIKSEGDLAEGMSPEIRSEVLAGQAFSPYWDMQLGVRADTGGGPERRWLAAGVQGMAPYWFEIDAFVYLGEGGRTALRLGLEYDLLLTQRLILQPRAELNVHGMDDLERGIGKGLSTATAGLRLRYEINRQLAPYVGVEWNGKYGATADLASAAGDATEENKWVAGLRFWF